MRPKANLFEEIRWPDTDFDGKLGLFEWTGMPIALSNAKTTFQRAMKNKLSHLSNGQVACLCVVLMSSPLQLSPLLTIRQNYGSFWLDMNCRDQTNVDKRKFIKGIVPNRRPDKNFRIGSFFWVLILSQLLWLCKNFDRELIHDYTSKTHRLTATMRIHVKLQWSLDAKQSFE